MTVTTNAEGGEGSTPTYNWISRVRDYDSESKNVLVGKEVDENNHPLTPTAAGSQAPQSTNVPAVVLALSEDPLSKADPLLGVPIGKTPVGNVGGEPEDEGFVPWAARKPSILQKYTTNESIGISVKFMNEIGAPPPIKPQDTIKQRLEKLDETAESQQLEILQLNQKEYVTHIENLHEELIRAWDDDQRVKSLKIAIQCAKVCADTSVIKFYPSKFVLVTEILDTFGKLVFERIKRRSVIQDSHPPKPLPDMVTEHARETCRNWFFKIASIRELLPRIYIEMSIIRCYRFLTNGDLKPIFERLSGMLCGIGDPLVALYARAYLARKGREIIPHEKDFLLKMFYDFLFHINFTRQDAKKIEKILGVGKIKLADYLDLYSPGSEFLLQCIGHNASKELLLAVLQKYKETRDALILNHILSSFAPDFISSNAITITQLIREANDESFSKFKLYSTLGLNLIMSPPPKEQQFPILNDVWKVVTKCDRQEDYVPVAEVFIDYPLKYFTPKETNVMLGDIYKHVNVDKAYENFQPQLLSIVHKVLSVYTDFSTILGMSNFLPLLDLFVGEAQVEVSKAVLESFARQPGSTADPVVVNAILTVAKVVHDSINSLSFIDEVRQVSKLISTFIQKIDYDRDVEKQLNFYTDCRRAFSNFDTVKQQIILGVCRLVMKTYELVKYKHNKKTAAFVRACLAFCFITIPVMDDILMRLNLYILAGQIALFNQSVPQAEALFKAAIALIPEVPNVMEIDGQVKSTEEQLIAVFNGLAGSLVVVPGHPEHGPFYLIKGLVKVLSDYKWERSSTAKARVSLNLLSTFAAMSQPSLIYHVPGVESNDLLYAGETEYIQELNKLIDQMITNVLGVLLQLKEDPDVSAQRNQAALALDLYNFLVVFSELNSKSATFAVKIYTQAKQNGAHSAFLRSSLEYLKQKQEPIAGELYKKLKG